MALRDFQQKMKAQIYQTWGEPNVFNTMAVLPTGGGKTVLFCNIVAECGQPTCIVAHRQELVAQASLALCRENVPHGIIAPRKIQQQIIALHHETFGRSSYSYRSDTRVAGVDTLLRHDVKDRWLNAVKIVVQDEGHHLIKGNKWANAQMMFPNARGLFFTAHALRGDGRGLGRNADGLVDALVLGPCARDLINRGFLTDYRLVCPGSDIDFSSVKISSATGDYSLPELRAATHKSGHIVGDVVRHYLQYAAGKLGITFVVDIEHAREICAAYIAAGVPAQVITAKTPINMRGQFMKQFRARGLLQLVSVDCLGEGVDVPAIEVVSMVRKTASFQVYAQHTGRALRVMAPGYDHRLHEFTDAERLRIIAASPKPKAILIDHVGNCMYHGLPCVRQNYTLERRESRGKRSDVMPLRACTSCALTYERYRVKCPYCGHEPKPAERSAPEFVDGDLIELDPAVLAALRGEVARVDAPPNFIPGSPAAGNIIHNHTQRQQRQSTLRHAMRLWGAWKEQTLSTREAQKMFYIVFGIDVESARALNAAGAAELEARIRTVLARENIVEATA